MSAEPEDFIVVEVPVTRVVTVEAETEPVITVAVPGGQGPTGPQGVPAQAGPSTIEYDADGLMISATSPNESIEDITYNDDGQIETFTENGVARTITYNADGQIESVS